MKKLTVLSCASALVFAFGVVAEADDEDVDKKKSKSDFALFDGTNAANLDAGGKTGVLCGVSNKDGDALRPGKEFTYYFSVTSDAAAAAECKVIYTDGDSVRYKIPVGTSLNISQAGGSGVFDAAVRLDCDADISGAGSIIGQKRSFCISCDAAGSVCDIIIPNASMEE